MSSQDFWDDQGFLQCTRGGQDGLSLSSECWRRSLGADPSALQAAHWHKSPACRGFEPFEETSQGSSANLRESFSMGDDWMDEEVSCPRVRRAMAEVTGLTLHFTLSALLLHSNTTRVRYPKARATRTSGRQRSLPSAPASTSTTPPSTLSPAHFSRSSHSLSIFPRTASKRSTATSPSRA